jgi:Alternative oxidase
MHFEIRLEQAAPPFDHGDSGGQPSFVYLVSPRIAYQFLELLESHAVDTYATFINENRSNLAALPAPQIAKSYYVSGDLYVCA